MAGIEPRELHPPGISTKRISAYSPTKASLAKHSPHLLKRDRTSFGFEESPSKRHKSRPLGVESQSPHRNRKTLGPGIIQRDHIASAPIESESPRDAQYTTGRTKRLYLAESGKLNNQRDYSTRRQGITGKDSPGSSKDKTSFFDVSRGLSSQEHRTTIVRGTRLSRTPPPLNNHAEDRSDPLLPPTPERAREVSPSTRRRERESIFSSGGRKTRTKSGLPLEGSLGSVRLQNARPLSLQTGSAEYYPALAGNSKDKRHWAYLEQRNFLQKEVKRLDDELIIARRKAKIQRHHNQSIDLDGTLSQMLLKINETITAEQSTTARFTYPNDVPMIQSALPIEATSKKLDIRSLCPLSFTKSRISMTEVLQDDLQPSYQRIFQGYSHESLLHFQANLFIDGGRHPPSIYELSVGCSEWARPELSRFLQRFADERNIAKALYAISSFSKLARARADTWARLRKTFPDISIPSLPHDQEIERVASGSKSEMKLARRDLVANLSRRVITFQKHGVKGGALPRNVEVSISWHIEIDATGGARSNICAVTKMSTNSARSDESNLNQQVSRVLNILIAEYGMLGGMTKLLKSLFRGI